MLDKYGEPYLRNLWETMGGATRAAKVISDDLGCWVTEERFDYCAKLFGWRRSVRRGHPIELGVRYGTTTKEQYPRLIFPGDDDYEE